MAWERTAVGLDVPARSVVAGVLDTTTGQLWSRRLRRENRELREEREILARPRFLRQEDRSPVSCYRLIDAEKAHHDVSRLARVRGVHARAITSRPYGGRRLLVSWRGLPPLGR